MNSQQKGGEQREALAAPQPATAKEATVRSRVLRRDNIAYLCIYLRNAGERLRAIMLAADVFDLNVKQAKEWVDSVTYIREKIDNSKAREAFAKYPTDLIAEVSLEDSYEIRVSHFPSEEDVLLRTSDPLAAGAQPAAPATQESQPQEGSAECCCLFVEKGLEQTCPVHVAPASHPEGAATFKIGDLVIATKTLFAEATDELPAQDFCNVGDTLEVRAVAGFWPYSVAHPNREKGAMFGVSADEIEPLTKLPAPATPPSITDAAKEILDRRSIITRAEIESILSRLLGAQAVEVKRLREALADLESFATEETERVKAYDVANAQLRQYAKRLHVEVERYIVALTIAMEHVAGNGTSSE